MLSVCDGHSLVWHYEWLRQINEIDIILAHRSNTPISIAPPPPVLWLLTHVAQSFRFLVPPHVLMQLKTSKWPCLVILPWLCLSDRWTVDTDGLCRGPDQFRLRPRCECRRAARSSAVQCSPNSSHQTLYVMLRQAHLSFLEPMS